MFSRRILILAPRVGRQCQTCTNFNLVSRSTRNSNGKLQSLRFYATPGRPKTAVGESTTVKRRPAVRKSPKSSTTDASTAKSTSKTKAKPKTKAKAAPKKPVKKVLTEQQKEKKAARAQAEKVRALKTTALKPPGATPLSAWNMYVKENTKSGSEKQPMSSLASNFKALSSRELEHYNHIAVSSTTDRASALRSWVETHSPKVIAEANAARRALTRLDKAKDKTGRWPSIEDHRLPARPATAYVKFYTERNASGDFNHIAVVERSRLAAAEWKELPASEKEKYETETRREMERYKSETEALLR